ncbi:MAG: M1 family aminopeptidase [Ignavibacteria bacterium]|nr:M1 family aminopeptidase [Ignavibacteria bacterium]
MKFFHFTLLTTVLFFTSFSYSQNELEESECSRKGSYIKALLAKNVNYPGDESIDIKYYGLELQTFLQPNSITGKVRIISSVVMPDLLSVFFDLNNSFTVSSVKINDNNVSFTHSNNKLQIQLDRVYTMLEQFTTDIEYAGVPGTSGFGSFVFSQHNGEPVIWSLSEPYGTSEWFPCKDTPADKADSSDVYVRVPSTLFAVSNGKLIDVIDNGDLTKTYKWKNSYPIAHYLISVAISNYHEYLTHFNYSQSDSMPVVHYIYPENFTSYKTNLDKTISILEIFTGTYGEYPFIREKYGHAECGFSGGMEHQTISSMGAFSETIIAHELAHQWFGDKVTCKDWQNIWLNEGFATYSEGIFLQNYYGETRFDQYITGKMNQAKLASGSVYAQDISSVSSIFNYNRTYAKGAMILHMLRGITGDSLFFQIMKHYNSQPHLAYNVATTEDFQIATEAILMKPMDYFFQQWIYGTGYPTYNVNWNYIPAGGELNKINLSITQSSHNNPTYFTMPIQIKILTSITDTIITVFNDNQIQNFELIVRGTPQQLILDPNNYILKNATVTNIDDIKDIPSEFYLGQNYPNPFNPITTISWQIVNNSFVTLKVYDFLGKEVQTLVSEYKNQGTYKTEFDASDLTSGIYFYELKADDLVSTKKLVLIK